MPKLQLFAPCERLIIEQGSNTVSLISLLSELTITVPAAGLPNNAKTGQTWYTLAQWTRADDDAGQYHQRVMLIKPGGVAAFESHTKFEMDKPTHRIVGVIQGFPIKEAGAYVLRLELEQDDAWVTLAEYALTVTHQQTTRAQGSVS